MEAQIEEAIKFRKKANFKILTRLSQIIDQYPYLRFHQILMIYKVSELGVDKFNEESVETLNPNYVDCGTDVDKFINICLQFK